MSDRRLLVFHTVARLLSFTKAAETLHMTQPAVTFQVRQLEDHFNIRLFDRTHNRIALTEAGDRIYEYAGKILDLYNEMDNSIRELTGEVSGELVLGASTTVAEYIVPNVLGEFHEKFPAVIVQLKVANSDAIVSMVESNLVDLGIVESPVANKKLQLDNCLEDELVVVVPPSHDLAKKKSLKLEEVAKFPYIWREDGSGTREVTQSRFKEAGVDTSKLDVVMQLGSPEAIKGAVESGIGITILSKVSVQKEVQLGTLKAIPLNPPMLRPLSFLHQKQKFRLRAVDELLEFAKKRCALHEQNMQGKAPEEEKKTPTKKATKTSATPKSTKPAAARKPSGNK